MPPHLIFPVNKQFRTQLKENIIQNLDEKQEVVVVGCSFYPGETPRAIIKHNTGALFFDIQLNYLNTDENEYESEFVYDDCPRENPVFSNLQDLFPSEFGRYNRSKQYLDSVSYIATVEWPNHNEMFHILQNQFNQLCVWPHHKLWLDTTYTMSLPWYNKIKIKENNV